VAVHEHHLGVGAPQLLGGADPGEASAEDEDARALAHVAIHGTCQRPKPASSWSAAAGPHDPGA
jgi:hypothetical protein